jgi:DedD protein
VQIGAFAEADSAQQARRKAEGAGLKTYTQVVSTADGKRTRVRVGPSPAGPRPRRRPRR